ncbi:MAG: hypothetical protein N5P05_000884 [Chroococcopsis gigantea SAG 12.99]|jgi:hypothetical protein|nr:hypothetical protein [Chlorogloea purpurea SAG 13.99]MDV2999278.1 hypothetical protein [Chroococcopsis gigantea SAG 12.99]
MAQLHPHQIVSLDHLDSHLLGEIIQIIPSRECFWVRPLLLIIDGDEGRAIDLRSLSDLILPSEMFRPALDTEILPYLPLLEKEEYTLDNFADSRQYLHNFIQGVWQDYKGNYTDDR